MQLLCAAARQPARVVCHSSAVADVAAAAGAAAAAKETCQFPIAK